LARPRLNRNLAHAGLPKRAGYSYVCDWVRDEQPTVFKTCGGEIVNAPYTQKRNDISMMQIQHHKASEYRKRTIDQFEQLYLDARHRARVIAIVLHPYILGALHRLKYFRQILEAIRHGEGVVFWTGEQILAWFEAERRCPFQASGKTS
jgi:allantoinase